MKRLFFRLLFTLFVVALFSIITLTIWFSINSKDLQSVDLGVFASEPDYLSDDENAYYRIEWSGLSEISDELKSSTAVSFENLLFGDSWNDEYVHELLHRYQEDLLSLEKLPRDLDFQLPHSESVYDLPDYIPIVNLARLSLVKAEYLRRNGDIDSALSTLDASIHFANSIKNEKNNFLISYAIGLILVDESILQIQFVLDDLKISKAHILKIRAILSSLDSFLDDNIFKAI